MLQEYKSTQHFIAMLLSEQIYISALQPRMGTWRQHFPQIKIKEWMQEFLDDKLSAEIIRTTTLTCINVGNEQELKDRLDEVFGYIYQLMTQTDNEICVTDAWELIRDSVQYGSLPHNPNNVYYSRPIFLEAKQTRDDAASNKRPRTEAPPSAVTTVHAWLEQMKCLSE